MNMKKMWKRFFSLDRHHAEGFTLIELIVVIAILAILGGVAVPAYSGYVEKANIGADQSLVSEVAHALTLYYYSHPETTGGYVVLKQGGTESTADAVGEAAMLAVFGEGWQNSAVLKYDGWNDDGLMGLVAGYTPDEIATIADSTFVSVSTPESLMSAVTDMTDLVSQVVGDSNLAVATERLENLGMTAIADKLNAMDLDPTKAEDKQAYTTALSNLMVNEMANRLQNSTGDDPLTTILFLYSSALAYGEDSGDYSVLDQINANLASDAFTYNVLTGPDYLSVVANGVMDANGNFVNTDFKEFGAKHEESNAAALNYMMGAVEQISGSYTDKESLTNPNLFTTDAVGEQVNNYINAVKAMNGMSEGARTELGSLAPGAVAVFVANDGSVSVVPSAAWLAD